MKTKLGIVSILTLCTLTGAAFAQYRELKDDSVTFKPDTPIVQNSQMVVKNSGTDRNQKLVSIVGKSQILKFDQGIKRVSIANPEIADIVVISPKQLVINGKKAGATSLVFWNSANVPSFYNLTVQQDSDAFIQAVNYIAPNEDVSILFNDTGAVLSGHVSSTGVKEKIKDLAKAYNVSLTDLSESPTKQVLLEVKVVEASKNFTRNLSSTIVANNLALPIDPKNIFAGALPNGGIPTGFNLIDIRSGMKYLWSSSDGKIAAQFSASEKKGDIKVLAEPKLLAVNGETASFNVGNEVPVPSSVGQYGNVAYSFKKTGVLLNFTPTILEESGRIKLQLTPEVSEIDRSVGVVTGNDALVVPGFKTRKVETTVELQDGETLVIAGLLNTTSSKNRSQVPILGDIPILGFLFRSTEDSKNDGELMIFITPHIVDSQANIKRHNL